MIPFVDLRTQYRSIKTEIDDASLAGVPPRERVVPVRWPGIQARTAGMLVLLFALTAAFRFLALKFGFVNDHFEYVSGGRQMLFGEWPTRDFIDPGQPLMFAASALAQRVFGQTLFAEGMLVAIAFGLAAAFTAAAVRQLTGSIALAILAALFEIAVFPRTYSYPKILAYAFAFWLYGRYLARPDLRRLFAIAAGVAIAFLFRHDHGLFLWAGGVLTAALNLESTSWKRPARAAAVLTAFVVLLLLPYLIYVQVHGGLWQYFRTGVEYGSREASRQWHVWPRIFGDARPLESALVYELYLLPAIAIAVVLAGRARADARAVAVRVLPLAVVALLVNVTFIRDPLSTRLADAIVPAVMLGAWLLARTRNASASRALAIPIAMVCTGLMGASVLAVGHTRDEIDRAGLLGHAEEIPGRFVERTADLRARFTDYQLPSRAARRLLPFFRYVDRCTSTTDRILVGGYLPEIPFYARRMFAAGQEYFGGYYSSDANQRFAYDHLRRQSVPLVIISTDYQQEFDSRFLLVAGYVHARYALLTDVPVDDGLTIRILVSRDMPAAARDPETGWPCFR